ncbi:MAG: FHA domain-containing protein [Pseudomonadota bacterium]
MSSTSSGINRISQSLVWTVWALIGALLLALAAWLFHSSRSGDPEASVFRVYVETARGAGSGTSFLVSGDNTVVTNYHVIAGAEKVLIEFSEDGQFTSRAARVVWQSKAKDLAILQTLHPLRGQPLTLASFGETAPAKTEPVSAIGFPAIASSTQITGKNSDARMRAELLTDASISTGTVQRLVPSVDRLLIQHSADIHGGNSGGPLIDSCNRVVGVNTLGLRGQTLEYSVHIQEVARALNREDLAHSTASGQCLLGMTSGSAYAMGGSAVLGFVALLFAGLSFGAEGSRASAGAPVGSSAGTTSAMPNTGDTTGILRPETPPLALRSKSGGSDIDLTPFSAKIDDTGVTVGRLNSGADIEIADPSVSRAHARISRRGSDCFLTDMGSTNGTFRNGKKLSSGDVERLADEDEVRFAEAAYTFDDSQSQAQSRNQSDMQAGLIDDEPVEVWMLSGFDRNGTVIQHSIDLTAPSAAFRVLSTVGRSSNNDLVIDDPSVSRNHAELGVDVDGALALRDLESSNGTRADGVGVTRSPTNLSSVKILVFGDVELSLSRIR